MEAVDFGGQCGAFFQQALGLFRVVPEAVLGNDGFQLLEAVFFAFEVKDSPEFEGGDCGRRAGFV
jgi:hypothetical protein